VACQDPRGDWRSAWSAPPAAAATVTDARPGLADGVAVVEPRAGTGTTEQAVEGTHRPDAVAGKTLGVTGAKHGGASAAGRL